MPDNKKDQVLAALLVARKYAEAVREVIPHLPQGVDVPIETKIFPLDPNLGTIGCIIQSFRECVPTADDFDPRPPRTVSREELEDSLRRLEVYLDAILKVLKEAQIN